MINCLSFTFGLIGTITSKVKYCNYISALVKADILGKRSTLLLSSNTDSLHINLIIKCNY